MKKLFAVLFAIVFLMSAFAYTNAETVKMAYKGGSLNLRTGAGTNYPNNGYVFNGDTITVLSKGSSWSKIETADGRVGYIKNLYISGNGSQYADGTTYYSKSYNGKIVTKYSGSKVNLRAGASAGTVSMGSVTSGDTVKVLGKNGSWYLIETRKGTQGYISSSYVSTSASPSTETTAKVTGSAVNMRCGAGTKYAVVTTLVKGTKVKVLDTSNAKWWKVQYSNYVGYMSSNYLRK